MVSPTVNVFRYSALTFGILYGFLHRRTLQSAYDEHKITQAVHGREKVIKEAKEAWKREKSAGLDDGVITDPEDPRFDLDKLVKKWEAEAL